jgi:hypothetical protein
VISIKYRKKTMAVVKDISLDIIQNMPDDCSVDDIMYELNFISKVLEGNNDAESGRYITKNELLEKVALWGKSSGQTEQLRI